MEFDTIISINYTAGNYQMRHQRLANATSFKCNENGYFRKDCPNSTHNSPFPDHTLQCLETQQA